MMGSLFRRVPHRRRQEGLRDEKTSRLYRAACRLLAERDPEQIPVAHFAQAAEMSVGAVYERFPNKDAFLGAVITQRLSGARRRMQDALDPAQWQRRPAAAVTDAIVEAMMQDLHGHGAGVVRAALKRGHHDRTKLAPLEDYRTALADQAVALLAHRAKQVKHPERTVRIAVQMAEATALDALLHERGPLRPGGRRMATTLRTMMLNTLRLGGRVSAAGEGDDAAPEPADDDEGDDTLPMPIEEVVAQPISDSPPGRKSPRRRNHAVAPVERIPTIRPTAVATPPMEARGEGEEPLVRRRHRPRF